MPSNRLPSDTNTSETEISNERTKQGTHVTLSPPWGREQSISLSEHASTISVGSFVEERSRVHAIYIREHAKNKRIGLILSAALILLAALIVTFAPEGRQTMSYWIGAALLVFAAGASGFGRIWGKTKNISFGADQDSRSL